MLNIIKTIFYSIKTIFYSIKAFINAIKTLPDIVTEGANGMLGMKTDAIIPYLVKAIKELKQENEALKVRIFKLESK